MAKGDIRSGSAPLKQILEMMIEDLGCAGKLKEARVLEILPDVLGEVIMKKIDRCHIYDAKLFLRVSSAPMKHELFLMKDAILQKLNAEAGEDVLVDIVFR